MTVIVVQSGDLAAWVGAASGLTGVVLGASIDAWRRRQADRKQRRRDLIDAGSRIASAAAAYWRAARAAGAAQNEPQWRPLLDSHLADMRAAAFTITQAGIPEIYEACLPVLKTAFSAEDPSTPGEASALAYAQADVLRAYNETVRKAKL